MPYAAPTIALDGILGPALANSAIGTRNIYHDLTAVLRDNRSESDAFR